MKGLSCLWGNLSEQFLGGWAGAILPGYPATSFGYARKVTADTFMKSRNQDDNQRKAATLAGPRFICTSEVSEEQRLNEQLIKDITGGDTLEARKLYQEAFTFKPQFKAWMYALYSLYRI